MRGRNFSQLVPLCNVCHEAAEFADNRKAELPEANRRLEKLVGATPLPKPKKSLDAWAVEREANYRLNPTVEGKNRRQSKRRLEEQRGSSIPVSRAPLPSEYGDL